MQTLGIVGGLGPESTVDYYRSIIGRFRARTANGAGYPHIVINSLDVDRGIAMLNEGRLSDLTDYLAEAVESLARAGAEFGAIAANTPHIVFDQLLPRSPIPLISIVDAACERAKSLGVRRLALFGTGFTMGASFYFDTFERAGITLIRPAPAERELIHRKYIGELLNNQFLPETRSAIFAIAERLKRYEAIEGLVLAGTELPLLLRESPPKGLEVLDTSEIHVEAIVDHLLATRSAR